MSNFSAEAKVGVFVVIGLIHFWVYVHEGGEPDIFQGKGL